MKKKTLISTIVFVLFSLYLFPKTVFAGYVGGSSVPASKCPAGSTDGGTFGECCPNYCHKAKEVRKCITTGGELFYWGDCVHETASCPADNCSGQPTPIPDCPNQKNQQLSQCVRVDCDGAIGKWVLVEKWCDANGYSYTKAGRNTGVACSSPNPGCNAPIPTVPFPNCAEACHAVNPAYSNICGSKPAKWCANSAGVIKLKTRQTTLTQTSCPGYTCTCLTESGSYSTVAECEAANGLGTSPTATPIPQPASPTIPPSQPTAVPSTCIEWKNRCNETDKRVNEQCINGSWQYRGTCPNNGVCKVEGDGAWTSCITPTPSAISPSPTVIPYTTQGCNSSCQILNGSTGTCPSSNTTCSGAFCYQQDALHTLYNCALWMGLVDSNNCDKCCCFQDIKTYSSLDACTLAKANGCQAPQPIPTVKPQASPTPTATTQPAATAQPSPTTKPQVSPTPIREPINICLGEPDGTQLKYGDKCARCKNNVIEGYAPEYYCQCIGKPDNTCIQTTDNTYKYAICGNGNISILYKFGYDCRAVAGCKGKLNGHFETDGKCGECVNGQLRGWELTLDDCRADSACKGKSDGSRVKTENRCALCKGNFVEAFVDNKFCDGDTACKGKSDGTHIKVIAYCGICQGEKLAYFLGPNECDGDLLCEGKPDGTNIKINSKCAQCKNGKFETWVEMSLCGSSPLLPNENETILLGKVSGSIITNGVITLLNSSGKKINTQTDAAGNFAIPIRIGQTYKVTVSAPGYKDLTFDWTPTASNKNYFTNIKMEKTASEKVGNFEITELNRAILINAGWNLLTLPLNPTGALTAKGFLEEINSSGGEAYTLSKWDNSRWETYSLNITSNDFTLEPGKAYFIEAAKDSVWQPTGLDFTQPVTLDLKPGWNAVGLPKTTCQVGADCNASGVLAKANGQIFSRFESGLWDSLAKEKNEVYGNNFSLENFRGYFLKVSESTKLSP